MIEPIVSVIIPVFNAEKYLEKCCRSLFEQSLESIEYIFIDDKSTDGSFLLLNKILKDYPNRIHQVTIIQNNINRGSATTRNIGLDNARGKFIAFTDADDWIEIKMFENLANLAISSEAEMTWCGFFNDFIDKTELNTQEFPENPKLFAKALLAGKMQGMLWNKLFSHDTIRKNRIRFLDNCNMAEDRNFLFKHLCSSEKIVYLPEILYHYIQLNSASITRDSRMIRVYEEIKNVENMIHFIEEKKLDWFNIDELSFFKFRTKKRLLYSSELIDFKNWKSIFPDSNSNYKDSDLNLRHKILAFSAINNLWLIIKIWVQFKLVKKNK